MWLSYLRAFLSFISDTNFQGLSFFYHSTRILLLHRTAKSEPAKWIKCFGGGLGESCDCNALDSISEERSQKWKRMDAEILFSSNQYNDQYCLISKFKWFFYFSMNENSEFIFDKNKWLSSASLILWKNLEDIHNKLNLPEQNKVSRSSQQSEARKFSWQTPKPQIIQNHLMSSILTRLNIYKML